MWTAVAVAAPLALYLDEAEFEHMVAAELPELGEQVGRQPVGTLETGILTRTELIAAAREAAPDLPAPERLWSEQQVQALADKAVAVYVPDLQGIYLVKENLEALFVDARLTSGHLRPLVRCVIAHEIVHALQHQYGRDTDDPDPDVLQGELALREGHATLEEERWCLAHEGPVVARLMQEVQGTSAPGTMDPGDALTPYVFGRRVVQALQEEDPELVWSALLAPAPSWRALVEDVRPSLGAGWEDPAPIVGTLASLGVVDARPIAHGLGPLAPLLGVAEWELPEASAGWGFHGEDLPIMLVAVRLLEEGMAAPIVEQRRAQLAAAHSLMVATDLPGRVSRVKTGGVQAFASEPRIRAALRVRVSDSRRSGYTERWLATDKLLVVLASTGDRPARELEAALLGLLAQLPERPPEAPSWQALRPWLEGVRAGRASVVAISSPEWRLHSAEAALGRDDPSACIDAFSDVLGAELPDAEPWARAAYRCAAMADDLATADRAAQKLHQLEPGPGAMHAWSLLDQGRLAEALAVLDRVVAGPDTSEEEASLLLDVRMVAMGEARRWTELAALAAQGGSAEMRLQAAGALLRVGRRANAQEIPAERVPGHGARA